MSYFNNIGTAISTLWEGMKVTMGYLVRARDYVTLQYPDEVWPVPSRNIGVGDIDTYNVVRSKLHVNMNDCIGCKQCERACPVDCIKIDTIKGEKGEDLGTTSNGTAIKLLTYNFTIDMTECMYCDLCTFPCPEDCIFMTPDYQFLTADAVKTEITPEERWRDRDHLIYQFATVPQEEVDRRLAAQEAAKAAKLAAAAKAQAAKPNVDIPLKGIDTPAGAPSVAKPETPNDPVPPETGGKTAPEPPEGESHG